MDKDIGGAHLTQFFSRNNAGFECIRLGFGVGLLVYGKSAKRSAQDTSN
jgi:hypothetical protein